MITNGNSTGDRKKRLIRCAIYTRKSTKEGLEQDYNTLDAQRDSGESYIASLKGEGWVCLPTRYDDGGYTGGNMERPALGRLLADIERGQIDCIVVYKVDRLSRSLLDFARIMSVLERHQVAFVSVTQQFNTNTSMGRLMLNILLSFAQFERALVSERTRDKIAAARRKGKWLGGRYSATTWCPAAAGSSSTGRRPARSGRSSSCTCRSSRCCRWSGSSTIGAGGPSSGRPARTRSEAGPMRVGGQGCIPGSPLERHCGSGHLAALDQRGLSP